MSAVRKSLKVKRVLLLSAVTGLLGVAVLFAHREAGAGVFASQHLDPGFFAETGADGLACARCHNDYPLITISELGDPGFTIDDCGGNMGRQCAGLFTNGYVPGQLYQMRAIISYSGMSSWGFDLWVTDDTGATAGTLNGQTYRSATHTRVQGGITVRAVGNEGAGYRHNGVYDGPVGWRFSWRAPDTDIGPVHFFAEGTAANRDRTPRGDYSYYLDDIVVYPAAVSQ